VFLTPLNQPSVAPLKLAGERPLLIGRAPGSDLTLADGRISSKHAMLVPQTTAVSRRKSGTGTMSDSDNWAIVDLNSRNGVRINNAALTPGQATPVHDGDVVSIGPLPFRVSKTGSSGLSIKTIADNRASIAPPPGPAPTLTPQVLRALSAISEVRDLGGWPERVAASAQKASGFQRCFVLESDDDDTVGIAASYPPLDAASLRGPLFSRTLIRLAREQGVSVLGGETGGRTPSLIGANVGEACCVAIRVQRDAASATTTADTLDPPPDAAPYLIYAQSGVPDPSSQASRVELLKTIATIAASTRSALLTADQSSRQQTLRQELQQARAVQQRLQPTPQGRLCGCDYAVLSQPGNLVAGDMVDLFALPGERIAIMLGDVTGKGPAAAMLMATLQARVREALTRGASLLDAIESVSADIALRHAPLHASLWLSIWDPQSRTLHSVDAGHGFAALCVHDAPPRTFESEGGVWLGIEDAHFAMSSTPILPRARLVLYSDGIAEQTSADAQQFGMQGVLRTLESTSAPADDVAALHAALTKHAGPLPFGDDVTALSIAL
jgi:serine phosphatase RsbU (regulator of sigma subunit)